MNRSIYFLVFLLLSILYQQYELYATSITVSGNSGSTYYLFDQSLNELDSEIINGFIEVTAGTYIVKLNNCYKQVSINDGDNLIIKTARLCVLGQNNKWFYVYKNPKLEYLTASRTNSSVDLLEGKYIIKINNTFYTITLSEEQNIQIQPEIIKVLGTGLDTYYVYDNNMNELARSVTNTELGIFPGEYFVKLNNTIKKISVEPNQRYIIKSGTITVTGTGRTEYYVFYDTRTFNIYNNILDNSFKDMKIALNTSINSLKIAAGMDDKPNISSNSYSNFLNLKQLKNRKTNESVELFPGDYLIMLNKTFITANVQEGQNTIVKSSTASISGKGNSAFYVYDLSYNLLQSASTNDQVELFPGEYVFKLNNTYQTEKVLEGQNKFVKSGTLLVSGYTGTPCYVYDIDKNEQLCSASINQQIEIFPGNYVLKLRNSFINATVNWDQTTIIKTGTMIVSGISGKFYVYDCLNYNQVAYSSVNQKIDLLPGNYIVNYNKKSQVINITEEKDAELNFQ